MGRLVVFDLDGTLIDSEGGIVYAMECTVAALGLPADTVERWRGLIGVPLRDQMPLILPADRLGEAAAVVEYYRNCYREIMLETSRPFPGTDALLAELLALGVTLAICSGKRGNSIRTVLAHAGWSEHFATIVSPDDVVRGKPHPESMQVALTRTGFSSEQAIMVGDTTMDIEMARGAGVPAVAVTWGTHDRTLLATSAPAAWAHTVAELAALLRQWCAHGSLASIPFPQDNTGGIRR